MKKFIKKVSKNKVNIALVLIWAFLLAFLVIKAYWLSYNTSNRLIHDRPLVPTYDLRGLDFWDLFVIFFSGVVMGLFLSDVKAMFYGYVAALFLSYAFSVTYITLYIWYVLDFGSLFSLFAYDWELAVYAALAVAFTIVVPWMICFCLVGLVVGAFLRTWIG